MILVAGEALIDLIQSRDDAADYRAVVGGANANVALALARRGVPQRFLGRISTDPFGRQIREHLSSNGVDLSLSISAAEPTTLAIASIAATGSAEYSFYIDGTADWGWQPTELPTAQQALGLGAIAIQYGCLAMALSPGNDVLEAWLRGLHTAGGQTLSHDLNIRAALGFERETELARVTRLNQISHIIKASDADLQWLYGLGESHSIDSIAADWAQAGQLVVITRGSAGATLFIGERRIDVAAPKVVVVDTVGAGDTFMANLLAELAGLDALGSNAAVRLAGLTDAQLSRAAEVAAVAAALVCEREGCEPPTSPELAEALGS